MRVGIAVPYIGNFGAAGFYNSQELGIAKALLAFGHEPVVVKTYDTLRGRREERATPPHGIELHVLPAIPLGSHGLFSTRHLSRLGLDRLIALSDTQMVLPWLDAWCRRRAIPLLPYIGTIDSDKGRRGWVSRWSRARNLSAYRRRHCFAKTPAVLESLRREGVERATLMPVGLDQDLLVPGIDHQAAEARELLGIPASGPLAAFVGRLMPYKDPLALAPLLNQLCEGGGSWRLVLIGDGPLRIELEGAFRSQGVEDRVMFITSLRQTEMWKVYRAADVLINLNPQEIFGMSILESLYYGTPVVAVDAPGPRFIIREGVDGFLVPRGRADLMAQRVVEAAAFDGVQAEQAHLGVLERFDWKTNIERAGILSVDS